MWTTPRHVQLLTVERYALSPWRYTFLLGLKVIFHRRPAHPLLTPPWRPTSPLPASWLDRKDSRVVRVEVNGWQNCGDAKGGRLEQNDKANGGALVCLEGGTRAPGAFSVFMGAKRLPKNRKPVFFRTSLVEPLPANGK